MTTDVKGLVGRLNGAATAIFEGETIFSDRVHGLLTEAADTLQSQERRIGELSRDFAAFESGVRLRLWNELKGRGMSDDVAYAVIRSIVNETDEPVRTTLTTGGGHDGQG